MSKEKINLKKFDELAKNNPLSYEVMVYDVNKGRRKTMKSRPIKKKYTLNQVGDAVMQLTEINKNVLIRLDRLEKYTINGFKQINTRLDYIVSANKLKDLPKSK